MTPSSVGRGGVSVGRPMLELEDRRSPSPPSDRPETLPSLRFKGTPTMNSTSLPHPDRYAEMPQLVCTLSEAAAILRISPKTVRVLIRDGRLTAQRAGVRVLVPRASLLAFIEEVKK